MNPENSNSCLGVNTLFLVLVNMHPKQINVWRVVVRCYLNISLDWAISIIILLWRQTVIRTLSCWRVPTVGLRNFCELIWGTAEPKQEAAEFPCLVVPPEAEEVPLVGCNGNSQVCVLEV